MEDNITPIKEKLDDKIKKLNSSRVFKKVTPKGDSILVYQVEPKYGVNLMYGKCKCKLISLELVFWNDRCSRLVLGRCIVAR